MKDDALIRFALTIFLSAFLLFQVQPLVSKRILPWFGGSPAVWTTCMLFFQLLLLGGYVYAHLVGTRLGQRRQVVVHLAVLGLAAMALPLLFLPLYLGGSWKPSSPDLPTWRIAWLLAVTVGLPFFALSSTSPLLQKWFTLARPQGAVYRLYALSNVGSLLALVTFPVLMEPLLSARTMAIAWAMGFAGFVLLCAWSGLGALRAGVRRRRSPRRHAESAGRTRPARRREDARVPRAGLAPLAAAAGVRLHHAPGRDQRDVPGHRRRPVPVGAAAGTLPAVVHHLLRQRALVLSSGLLAADDRHDRVHVPRAARRRRART